MDNLFPGMTTKRHTNRKKKKVSKWPLKPIYTSITLFVISILLYANTITHDFTLDDAILITENTFTKQGVKGIPDIFTHDTFFGFFNKEGKDKLVSGGRYRPFTHALFAIEYQLYGKKSFWYHLVNILLYGLLCGSIFFILFSLFEKKKKTALSVFYTALFASVLFLVHPIHTEVVANIKGRDEIFALLTSLWSLHFILKGWKLNQNKWSVLGGILLLIGILSKENAITFTMIIPLTALHFHNIRIHEIHRVIVPVLCAFVIYLIIRFSVLGWSLQGTPPTELMNNPFLILEGDTYREMNLMEKWPLIIYGLGKAIQLLIFPHPLTHDYYPRQFPLVSWLHWKVMLSIVLYGLLIFASLRYLKKQKILAYSILFFFITFFLTSNIFFPIGTHFSERFLFMPSLGFCLGVSYIVIQIFRIHQSTIGKMSILALLVIMSAKSFTRNLVWKDNFTLFTTDVRTSAQSAKAQNAAGGTLISHAQSLTDTTVIKESLFRAINHLDKAIQIHPTYKNAYLLKGNALFYQKKYEEAIQTYDFALQIAPGYEEALFNRAITYRDLGRYYGEKTGDLSKAIHYLGKALEVLSNDFETNRLMAIAYGNSGNTSQAIDFFEKAVTINPKDGWTFYNLGMAYQNQGDSIKANEYIRKAKALNPEIGTK
jgi:tetratricopeptide (TPR) repeat protein